MHEPSTPQDNEPNRSSRVLVFIIAAIIVIAFVAFLVIRPSPGGGTGPSGGGTGSPASQH